MKLPMTLDSIFNLTSRLPQQVTGQDRLSYSGWRSGDQFIAAWGPSNGQRGMLPIQIVVRHVDSLGQQSAKSGGEAVIADANRTVNIAGRMEIGRDGQVVWLRRFDAGYTVAWGRVDSPWLYVVTASNEHDLTQALQAFADAVGRHGGNQSTLK